MSPDEKIIGVHYSPNNFGFLLPMMPLVDACAVQIFAAIQIEKHIILLDYGTQGKWSGIVFIRGQPFGRTLRSVNIGFAFGYCIAATSDFDLTAIIEVDYSLTDWFSNEQGSGFVGSDLIFGEL